jgi:hypothetical protein
MQRSISCRVTRVWTYTGGIAVHAIVDGCGQGGINKGVEKVENLADVINE